MTSIPPDSSGPQGGRDAWRPPAVSAEQNLPPVEPPSAGFLLQLFVVPAVIVAGVVLIWFTIESLARSGEQDPDAILRALRGSNGFQQAKDLADMLRVPQRYPELKTNRELAAGLAAYLEELLEGADDAEGVVTMRFFLVTALGELHVDDGVPVLVRAALEDPDRDVRRRALNALAVLGGTLAKLEPPQHLAGDELADALVKLASDEDELVRSETAFAIGVVAAAPEADSRLTEALAELADDPYTDARFNAAVALARLGSPRAAAAVAEMLDPEAVAASLTGEKPITEDQSEVELRSQRAYKRNTILTSALAAVELIVQQGATGEGRATLERALTKFIADAPSIQDPSPVPSELLDAAKRTLARVQAP